MDEKSCATTNAVDKWEDINFTEAVNSVKKLQFRIALAYRNGCIDKVCYLQHLLVRSFYARYLAVKFVTSNRGKKTVGVDNVLYDTPDDKLSLVKQLKRRGYKASPLRRIYIPKTDGNLRPLSIPTIKDRAMQTLYKFALEPLAEMSADECSFGYRPDRSPRGAITQCVNILSDNPNMNWVLKADIQACFDNISHEWILANVPMDKKILSQFLKCGYEDKGSYHRTDKGVPQGGCLSSVICNIALDGLEKTLADNTGNSVRVVRYADDIIVFGQSKAVLVQEVVPLINAFLKERGLTLSNEKTQISHIDNGVSFLGYYLYREGKQVLAVPQRKKIDKLLKKIDGILKGDFASYMQDKERCLNQVVRGWFNYYKGIAVEQALYGVEYEVILLAYEVSGYNIAGSLKFIFYSIFNQNWRQLL